MTNTATAMTMENTQSASSPHTAHDTLTNPTLKAARAPVTKKTYGKKNYVKQGQIQFSVQKGLIYNCKRAALIREKSFGVPSKVDMVST